MGPGPGTARRRVALVLGTRPEAIKLAPVVLALEACGWAAPVVVATGQHGDAVRDALHTFDLKADRELGLGRGGDTPVELYARLIQGVGEALGLLRLDLVVVQGDTASTLAGALAGFLHRVPVAHVEAGLRSHDLAAPFPEEANRQMVTRLASLHLAPTPAAVSHLRSEGVADDRVVLTGNTVIDALDLASSAQAPYDDDVLEDLDRSGRPVVLVTAHRRESWGEPIRRIGRAVGALAGLHPGHDFVVVPHMNPQARDNLAGEISDCPNVSMVGPMAYGPFVRLLARSTLAITDSGGIQEEAPALGVPVLVTREVTERGENVEAGTAHLVGTDDGVIVAEAHRLLADPDAHAAMASVSHPYGDGHAAERVAAACGWRLGLNKRPEDLCPPSAGTTRR